MFTAIKAALVALPGLIELIKSVLNGLKELVELQKENELKRKELLASQAAIVSKSTSDLEAIFRGE